MGRESPYFQSWVGAEYLHSRRYVSCKVGAAGAELRLDMPKVRQVVNPGRPDI